MDSTTQTALITGASGGIGYELAKLFARDHYNLVLVARSTDKLNQIAAELQSQFAVTNPGADSSQRDCAHASDPAVPSSDAGPAQREDYERSINRGFSAGAVDGRLLCDQGLCAIALGGAGE